VADGPARRAMLVRIWLAAAQLKEEFVQQIQNNRSNGIREGCGRRTCSKLCEFQTVNFMRGECTTLTVQHTTRRRSQVRSTSPTVDEFA